MEPHHLEPNFSHAKWLLSYIIIGGTWLALKPQVTYKIFSHILHPHTGMKKVLHYQFAHF